MQRLRALVTGVCATAVVLAAGPATAQTAPTPLHLRFRAVAQYVSSLTGTGDYVGYTQYPGFTFVVRDDRTGVQTVIRRLRPDCGPGVVGFPWVAFECGGRTPFQLYNIQTRRWRRIACDQQCQTDSGLINVIAVGARWLALSIEPNQPCGDGVHNSCGPTTYLFYNIASGKPQSPNLDATNTVDLNAPTLTRRNCPPLQTPPYPSNPPSFQFPPLLTFYGTFAVAQEQTGLYLQRCNSRLDMPLVQGGYGGELLGNTQAVAFWPPGQPATGIFLPSLRRFAFTLPRSLGTGPLAVLGPKHIYVFSPAQGAISAAAFVAPPRG